jgi:hypothetical protein
MTTENQKIENENKDKNTFYEMSLSFFALAITFVFFSWLLMESWNGVIPNLFKLPNITFGEACCLLMLKSILVAYKDNPIPAVKKTENN